MGEEGFLTLEDIEQSEFTKFAKSVDRANGKAIVLVHPRYRTPGKVYKTTLAKLLTQTKTPIVILEETTRIQRLEKYLAKIRAKDCLVLPTRPSDPKILIRINKKGYVAEKECEKLVGILKKAGAKKLFVGGMNALNGFSEAVTQHERKIFPKERMVSMLTIAGGCAGITYERLIESNQFEAVRLVKNICAPDKPRHRIDSRIPRPSKKPAKTKRSVRK